jgi:succinoglycan biosynthesis protein ExoM
MRLKVCVLVVTRNRPDMLGKLLSSLCDLTPVEDCELSLVVVANGKQEPAKKVFEKLGKAFGAGRSVFVEEPKLGIPIARNRALDEAAERGADVAMFIDDDEIADPAWISELVASYRSRNLELIGGPVRGAGWKEDGELTLWQKLILDGAIWRYSKKERQAARKVARRADDQITIVTNNWSIDLHWWKKSELRFDETLRYTGGSDAMFYTQAKKLSVKSGWCLTAIVHEFVPVSRLSFKYQFNRSRYQSMSNFQRKYAEVSPGVVIKTLVSCVLKIVAAIGCLISIPIFRGPATVQGARALGWAVGRIAAVRGKQSTQYLTVDGA